jgi:YesN/AraC family two-component response regulator
MIEKGFAYNDDNFVFCHNLDEKPTNISTHIHDCYEIFFFLSGDVTYFIEGQSYRLQEKDLIITNSRELHRIFLNSEEAFERKFIHFKPEYISSLQINGYNLLQFIEKRKLGYFNKINAADAIEYGIYSYLSDLEKHIKKSSIESPIMIKTLLVQMLVAINEIFNKNEDLIIEAYENNTKIAAILEYINHNYDKKISLNLLQDIFFVNKYYISHFFKKSTGFAVLEYITYKRIMMAKELLDNNLPVLEVADTVGFSDYSNFYKAFKKIVGLSPKRYVTNIYK